MADYLALHGFTQRGRIWDEVAGLVGGEWEMPDLPGHGETEAQDWPAAVGWVVGWMRRSAAPVTLVGYSMGGRLALAAALADPTACSRLVLASASPGISDPVDRERRRMEDSVLADRIERIGLEPFIDEWLAQPMFARLGRRPASWGAADRRLRVSNSAAGLADALRLLGQGAQPYLGDRVGELPMPVIAVAGETDEPYVRHAIAIAAGAPAGESAIVPGAGHPVVAEDPRSVAAAVAGGGG